ncbi:MAG TPA: hypothetical protein VNL13_07090 [Sulfolobales archaeon]|nr:hypothetical protein [Sulfolobales archaeon]
MPRCSVCGKVFPEGQGIYIKVRNREIFFHKKTCATKFLRELLPLLSQECMGAVESVLDGFSKAIEEKKREKRLPGT